MYLTHFVQDNTKILYWIAQYKSINDQHFTSQHEYIMMWESEVRVYCLLSVKESIQTINKAILSRQVKIIRKYKAESEKE